MPTLTKQAIMEAGKPKCEEVAIDGIGTVYIRSVSELTQSRRDAAAVNGDGKVQPQYRERLRAFAIIDQVCEAPSQPMFTDADLKDVLALDHTITRRLFAAVQAFNGEDDAKKKDESDASDAS